MYKKKSFFVVFEGIEGCGKSYQTKKLYNNIRKLNIPVQVLWGKNGVIGKQFKPIKIWQKYSNKKVFGFAVKSGHFIPEQNPKETIKHLKFFFKKYV